MMELLLGHLGVLCIVVAALGHFMAVAALCVCGGSEC